MATESQNECAVEKTEQLKDILCELLGDRADRSALNSVSKLQDLGINSIDYMRFVLLVEERFGIKVPDNAFTQDGPVTFGDWTRFIGA